MSSIKIRSTLERVRSACLDVGLKWSPNLTLELPASLCQTSSTCNQAWLYFLIILHMDTHHVEIQVDGGNKMHCHLNLKSLNIFEHPFILHAIKYAHRFIFPSVESQLIIKNTNDGRWGIQHYYFKHGKAPIIPKFIQVIFSWLESTAFYRLWRSLLQQTVSFIRMHKFIYFS